MKWLLQEGPSPDQALLPGSQELLSWRMSRQTNKRNLAIFTIPNIRNISNRLLFFILQFTFHFIFQFKTPNIPSFEVCKKIYSTSFEKGHTKNANVVITTSPPLNPEACIGLQENLQLITTQNASPQWSPQAKIR